MKDQISQVYEFNRSVIGIDRPQLEELTEKESGWLICTLEEETAEYVEAVELEDPVESMCKQIDSLVDLAFFALGGLIRLGLEESDARSVFGAVYAANMAKKAGAKSGRAIEFELDASKPEGWQSPDEFIRSIVDAKMTTKSGQKDEDPE